MDGEQIAGIVVLVGVLLYAIKLKNPDTSIRSNDFLNRLPFAFYLLAIIAGVVLIGFTIANSDELSSTEIGGVLGYTVGAVLSMLAVGRIIEVLHQIRDK